MTARSLAEIRDEMGELALNGRGDPESSHSRADDLLIETIRWFMAGHGRSVEDAAADIVAGWKRVEKWYA